MSTGSSEHPAGAPSGPPPPSDAAVPLHSTATDRLVEASLGRSSTYARILASMQPVSPPALRRNKRNAAIAAAPPASARAPRSSRPSASSCVAQSTSTQGLQQTPRRMPALNPVGEAGTERTASSPSLGLAGTPGEEVDTGGMEWEFGNAGSDEGPFIWPGSPTPNLDPAEAAPSSVELYGNAIFVDRTALLVRIDHRRWALEDFASGLPKRGVYVHLFRGLRFGTLDPPTCDCSSAQSDSNCRHAQVMIRYWDQFDGMMELSEADDPPAIRLKEFEDGLQGTFSIAKHLGPISDGKRTTVGWIRNDSWTCLSCRGGALPHTTCRHRQRAFTFVTTVLLEEVNMEPILEPPERSAQEDMEESALRSVADASATAPEIRAISYLPIPLPSWARLELDPSIPPPPSPLRLRIAELLASPLPLTATSRCYACPPDNITFYDPSREVGYVKAQLYTSWGIEDVVVTMQQCNCRSKHFYTIGPDLREHGIFNWKPETLVSHELLDRYSAAMQASPTPIHAEWTCHVRYYSTQCLPVRPFLGKTTFTSIIFAFMLNQTGRMVLGCGPCGPSPRRVIADGVATGYEAKRVLGSLRPPTVPGGEPCLSARKLSNLAFLVPKARKGALYALQGLQEGDEARVASGVGDLLREGKGVGAGQDVEEQELLASVELADQLGRLLLDLSKLNLSAEVIRLYSVLIKALCTPDQAPALIKFGSLQPVFDVMRASIAAPATADQLDDLARSCPSLGNLLKYYQKDDSRPPPVLHQLGCAIIRRVYKVHLRLMNHRSAPPTQTFDPDPDSWRNTGACYSLPQVRERPRYPKLESKKSKAGGGEEITEEDPGDEGCNKYYSEYSKSGKTGGMMVLWCDHGSCLGFHCIPQAEGRNDVFSAIFKFWPIAPELIVYDFACSLGAYSRIREADYFQNTLFATDQFHEDGHKTCATSTKLSSYMATDGSLQQLKSSLAECGNAGIGRIRKTVSFCSQPNAIIFARHFLVLWNGVKEVKRAKVQQQN